MRRCSPPKIGTGLERSCSRAEANDAITGAAFTGVGVGVGVGVKILTGKLSGAYSPAGEGKFFYDDGRVR